MRSTVAVLTAILLAICFFATQSLASSDLPDAQQLSAEGYGSGSNAKPWPCCDRCGICLQTYPPRCRCDDLVLSCHPECKNCIMSPFLIYPPRYICKDFIINLCEKKCNPESLEDE